MARIAVRQNGYALAHISEELRADRDIAMDAVRQNGIALRYVSAELKADRSIVMAAVKQFGWALAYIPSELADREIIMLAVAQCGSALQFASDENDVDVVAAAVALNRHALRHASAGLRSGPYVCTIPSGKRYTQDSLEHTYI